MNFLKKNKYVTGIIAVLLVVAVGTGVMMWKTASDYTSVTSSSSSEQSEVQGDIVDTDEVESSSSSESSTSSSSEAPPPPKPVQPTAKPPVPSSGVSSVPPPKPAPVPTPNGKNIVGYYTGYSAHSGFTPNKVDASKLTHINYAFAKIDGNSKIALADSAIDLSNFKQLRGLKNTNPNLKLLISVGGWDYSNNFSNAALTAQSRETFAQSCLDFILTHGFDGIDLDWEFPVSGGPAHNTNRPEDKQNFTLLLKAIREKLDGQTAKDGKRYYLTIAAAPNSTYLKKIELTKIAPLVDYIFLMGYDLHGPWDKYTDFGAPLYGTGEDSPQYGGSISDGTALYLNSVSSSKLVLGMPFYGHKYELNDEENNGLYQRYSSAKSIGYDNVLKNYLSDSAYGEFYHKNAKVPYLYGNGSFITYEDPSSIAHKVNYAKSKGLGGVGIWELAHDKNGNLLGSAYKTLHG